MNAPIKKTSKHQKKAVPKKSKAGTYSSVKTTNQSACYSGALLAIIVLMLIFTITNSWTLKLESQLYFMLGIGLVFIITFMHRSNRLLLSEKTTKVYVVLLAQCLLYFAGLFYGAYPKFALQQFLLSIGSLLVFVTAYVSFRRNEINIEKFTEYFSVCIVISSLISIELATSGHLNVFFLKIAEFFNAQLPGNYGVFETNTRIFTVFGNPNVFAPLAVFGWFLSLWNCGKAGVRARKNFVYMSFAIISGTTFILCFSLGTILTYFVMIVVFIYLSSKDHRGSEFSKHIFSLVISLISAGVVFALRDISITPLLSVAALSVIAAYLYTHISPIKLPVFIENRRKVLLISGIGLCAIFCICALILYGPYTLHQGGTFKRAVALKPGTYSIVATFDEGNQAASALVHISSMSYSQAALKEKTPLKTAQVLSGEAVDFIVPDSSASVYFDFTANTELVMKAADISGSSASIQLPLKYKLLPEFIVNRMQGLWVNDNAIQRFIFFRDGIRLGLKSPVVGLGGGAFEGGLYSVADYEYQTKHTHNEFIQRFIDGGIIGLILFTALAVVVFRALYKARKSERIRRIFPLLSACMVMVFLHSMIEVDFSMPAYRIATSLFFAVIAVYCDDYFIVGKKLKTTLNVTLSLTCLFAVLLAVGRYSAIKMIEKQQDLNSLETAVWLDPSNGADYKISYLLNTQNETSPKIISKQDNYLRSLKNETNGLDGIMQYYLLKPQPDVEKGIQAAELYVNENLVHADSWNKVFSLYNTALDAYGSDPDASTQLASSIKTLCNRLSGLNITLPKKIEAPLAIYSLMRAENLEKTPTGGFIVDSRILCDLNQDGKSDIVDNLSDNIIQWKMTLTLPAVYVIKIYQQPTSTCEILLDGILYGYEYNSEEGCFVAYMFMVSNTISDLVIKTSQYTDGVYFTIEKTN